MFTDKKVRRLLLATDLAEGGGSGLVTARLLDASLVGCALVGGAGSPGGKCLVRRFASG